MPVVASDIVVYGSAVMPDNDTPINIGGAIDLTRRVVFTDMTVTDNLSVVSSVAGDNSQDVTVTGRDSAGVIQTEVFALNGTTPVVESQQFERILKIVVSAAHTGVITVEDTQGTPNKIVDIESGVLEIRRPFYDAFAEATGGANKKYYEKVFFKNNHGTLALTNATIAEFADPSAKIAFGLVATLNDTGDNGASNRQTAPGGITFDSATKNVANGQNHSAGAGQGCWLELSLNAGDAANNTTYTLREAGTSV